MVNNVPGDRYREHGEDVMAQYSEGDWSADGRGAVVGDHAGRFTIVDCFEERDVKARQRAAKERRARLVEGRRLVEAATEGELDVVRGCVERGDGVDAEVDEKEGGTALYWACREGHQEIAKMLVEEGADKDKANNDGDFPLSTACQNGHLKVAKMLVEEGADKDKANNEGWTSLSIACAHKREELVEMLVAEGADKDKANHSGHTPLNLACYDGFLEIMKMLVEDGCDKDKADNDGDTPLFTATAQKRTAAVAYLKSVGAKG
jgi:ankyrin repeat protein